MVIKSGGACERTTRRASALAALVEVVVALSCEAAIAIRQKYLESYNHFSNEETND